MYALHSACLTGLVCGSEAATPQVRFLMRLVTIGAEGIGEDRLEF